MHFLRYSLLGFCALAMTSLVSCDDNELPCADFERYQVDGVKAVAGDETVTLSWVKQASVPDPQEFLVIWTPGVAEVEGGEISVDPSTTSVTIDNLVNDCKYTFSVQSRYSKGLSQMMSTTCTPKSTRIPASNFKVMAGDKRAYTTWTAPETSLQFSYRLDVYHNDKKVQSLELKKEQTSSLVEDLSNGVEYTFLLTCVYPHGISPALQSRAVPGEISPINITVENPRQFEKCVFEYNPAYFIMGEIVSVTWDFGDGASSKEPLGEHAFGGVGVYTVTITIEYASGQTETASASLTVVPFSWSTIDGVGYQKSSNIVFSLDGQTFYTASQTGKSLIAVDAINGCILWEYTTPGSTYGAGPAVGKDGTIYFGTENDEGSLFALTPSGSLKWQRDLGGKVKASPAITTDGMVYALVDGGTLCALDSNGIEKWRVTESGNAAAVVVDKDGTIIMATSAGIWAYNPSGTKKWTASESLSVTERGGHLAIEGDRLYAALRGKAGCAALDITNGNVLWKFATQKGDCYHPVVDTDGTVYFCEKSGYLYAVDRTGNLKWKYTDAANYIYNGFILTHDGRAVISQYASPFSLLAFDASGVVRELTNIGVQTMSPLTLGPDNRIYYSTNGAISAFDISVAAATDCWPMRGGNAQGTNSLK